MTNNYKPPRHGTPIALRLVPLITGYTIQELFNVLTKPIPYVDRDIIVLNTYQWPDKHEAKPAPTLERLLAPALTSKSLQEAITAIPPDLFVWSEDLESCAIHLAPDNPQGPPPWSHRPDWSPYIKDFEDPVRKCPPALRSICSIHNHKPRKVGKKETAERNALLQAKCDEILKQKSGLRKNEVASRLARIPEFKNITTETIKRNIRTRGRKP